MRARVRLPSLAMEPVLETVWSSIRHYVVRRSAVNKPGECEEDGETNPMPIPTMTP